MLFIHKFHVKIDDQAFIFIHVVEQVQLFKSEQPVLITSPSESEIVRGDKVVPMKQTILTWLVNSEVLWTKKNVKNSRLEVMEKSGVLCMCERSPCAISVYCQFFGRCTCKVLNQITSSRTEKVCGVVQACSDT